MNENFRVLSFTTDKHLDDYFDGKYGIKNLEIFPTNNREWTITLLICFLNELSCFKKAERRAYTTKTKDGHEYQLFLFKDMQNAAKLYIQLSKKIYVTLSTSYIKSLWERKHIIMFSSQGKGNKTRTVITQQDHIFYEITFLNPKDGTRALLNHSPLIFNSIYDFSDCFCYFAKKVSLNNAIYPLEDTLSLQEFIDLWIKTKSKQINSIDTLKSNIQGYLQLDIQQSTSKKRLAEITYDNHKYYIVSGVYISPWAKSLFADNPNFIDGFLLDTTWKIMSLYVTSIIMGSAYNVGLPLGFAFGHGEDKAMYKELLETLQDKLEIRLKDMVIESDQGSALRAICKELEMIHLACMRHLLVSLKYNDATYLISTIIKCATDEELKYALKYAVEAYEKLTDKDKIRRFNAALKKIGLAYKAKKQIQNEQGEVVEQSGEFEVNDEERWKAISMMHRAKYRMPSTTNALESTHGHLNKKTPRNNNFFMSVFRIVENLMKKSQTFEKCMKANYSRAQAVTKAYASNISATRMQDEQQHYQTTVHKCNCSENKLLSSMLSIDVPCAHRLQLGAIFPTCPAVIPTIKQQWTTLEIKYNIIPPDTSPTVTNADYFDKQYVVQQIRRYSHYKENEEITKYVEDNYQYDGTAFINKKPLSVIQIITEGVNHFSAIKAEQKLKKE